MNSPKEDSKQQNTDPKSEEFLARRDAIEKYLEENGIKRTRKTGGILMPVLKEMREAIEKSAQ